MTGELTGGPNNDNTEQIKMRLHVPLDQTVRLRYRHAYLVDGATIIIGAQSATINHESEEKCQALRHVLLGQWLPDGMYRGTYFGKIVGPKD